MLDRSTALRGHSSCGTRVASALLGLALLCGGSSSALETPAAIAVQFLTNVHTGVMMKSEEWLTREIRSADIFNAFGGLDRMVEQTTAHANRYGGLKSVELLDSAVSHAGATVNVRVTFVRDPRDDVTAPPAVREEMIWRIKAVQEDGKWKLSF